jgi:hypothetical protein
LRSALACLTTFRRDVLPTAEPVVVEAPFQLTIDDWAYSGIVDWCDDALHDLKTVGSRPSNGSRYQFAMTGYALGYYVLMAHYPADKVLDYIVRTKQPYHWPIRLGPLTDDEIDTFAATVGQVARGIAAGNYRPTGLEKPGVCAQCGHQETCEPWQALLAIRGESDGA